MCSSGSSPPNPIRAGSIWTQHACCAIVISAACSASPVATRWERHCNFASPGNSRRLPICSAAAIGSCRAALGPTIPPWRCVSPRVCWKRTALMRRTRCGATVVGSTTAIYPVPGECIGITATVASALRHGAGVHPETADADPQALTRTGIVAMFAVSMPGRALAWAAAAAAAYPWRRRTARGLGSRARDIARDPEIQGRPFADREPGRRCRYTWRAIWPARGRFLRRTGHSQAMESRAVTARIAARCRRSAARGGIGAARVSWDLEGRFSLTGGARAYIIFSYNLITESA